LYTQEISNVPELGFYENISYFMPTVLLQSSRVLLYAHIHGRYEKMIFGESGTSLFVDAEFQIGGNALDSKFVKIDGTIDRLDVLRLSPFAFGCGLKFQL
jgi:hypothetical protein